MASRPPLDSRLKRRYGNLRRGNLAQKAVTRLVRGVHQYLLRQLDDLQDYGSGQWDGRRLAAFTPVWSPPRARTRLGRRGSAKAR
jgi:hypothetical protein